VVHERSRTGWARASLAVAARPTLWPTAARQAHRLARPGWWRHFPFLPRPDRAYLAFRLETQYGLATAPPEPADLIAYLRWCRTQDRTATDPRQRTEPGPVETRQ
jgi:hypothetical protein